MIHNQGKGMSSKEWMALKRTHRQVAEKAAIVISKGLWKTDSYKQKERRTRVA